MSDESHNREAGTGPGRDLNNQPLTRQEVLQLLLHLLCEVDVTYSLDGCTGDGSWVNECDLIDQDKLQRKIQDLLDQEAGG